jgi:hypothetical protein
MVKDIISKDTSSHRRQLCDALALLAIPGAINFAAPEVVLALQDIEKTTSLLAVQGKASTLKPSEEFTVFVEPLWVYALAKSASESEEPALFELREHFHSRLQSFAEKYIAAPSDDVAGTLRGDMFEDAVVAGLRVQRECRRRLAQLDGGKFKNFASTTLADFFGEGPRSSGPQQRLEPVLSCGKVTADSIQLHFSTRPFVIGNSTRRATEFGGQYPALQGTYEQLTAPTADPALRDLAQLIVKKSATSSSSTAAAASSRGGESIKDATELLLVPRPPESNPLVDVIYHEYADAQRTRLVQFWLDAKHTANISLREPTGDKKQKMIVEQTNLVANIVKSLGNPLLQHDDCIVDHVVLVVLAPQLPNKMQLVVDVAAIGKTLQFTDEEKKKIGAALAPPRGRLKSFHVYVVQSGSPHMSLLLSQPIALTLPMMDKHDVTAWERPVPRDVTQWGSYTALKDFDTKVLTTEEKDRYEGLKRQFSKHFP